MANWRQTYFDLMAEVLSKDPSVIPPVTVSVIAGQKGAYVYQHWREGRLASAVTHACTCSRQKRKRPSVESSASEDDGPLAADETEELVQCPEEPEVQEADFRLLFLHQGQTVAVFYDKSFYVGQVLKVHNKDLAEVTFMTSKGNTNVFKWPQAEDLEILNMSRWAAFQKMFVH
ncbi:hypothetical protein BaRGS_00028497 [Batillaria attramentaria]|uniref:Uncharacterized protein n=1 Tax=Batillaria attramentaria TaxID=370345 RepID=A0ABD0JZM2_9CAEN